MPNEIVASILLLCGALGLAWLCLRPKRSGRRQAAAVCYRRNSASPGDWEFLLIRTKRGRRWIFPKGGIEWYESAAAAARKEAREEAGVQGLITGSLDPFQLDGEKVRPFLYEITIFTQEPPPERHSQWFDRRAAKEALKENRNAEEATPLLETLKQAHKKLKGD